MGGLRNHITHVQRARFLSTQFDADNPHVVGLIYYVILPIFATFEPKSWCVNRTLQVRRDYIIEPQGSTALTSECPLTQVAI